MMETLECIQAQGQGRTWPKVAIIVLNWNGWRDTIRCLESLQKITYPNYQIIVVDNGSTNDSVEKIKAWARGEIPVESKFFNYEPTTKPVKWIGYNRVIAEAGGIPEEEAKLALLSSNRRMVLIQTGENLGFAGGNNVGINYVLNSTFYYKYICLLNNDLAVHESFLEPLVNCAERLPNIGIVGPKVYFYDSNNVIQSIGGRINLWTGRTPRIGLGKIDKPTNNQIETINVDHISGCAMLISHQLIESIGLFDETFFLTFEDTDFCYRAKKAGFKVCVMIKSKVWHKESASTARPIRTYYSIRNRMLFMKKHAKLYNLPMFYAFYIFGAIKQLFVAMLNGDIRTAKAVIQGVKAAISLIIYPPENKLKTDELL